jgi:hypothetical protein
VEWFKVYPTRFLADVRRQDLSLEAQGLLLQACAAVALYDGDLDLEDLRRELRPSPSSQRFQKLITMVGPLLHAYVNDVQSQAKAYVDRSRKSSRAAAARWEKRTTGGAVDASAHDANAYAFAHANAHAEEKEENRSPLPPKADVHDHAFHRFWQVYPKKVNKSRALKAWTKLKPSDTMVEAMLMALAWQRDQPQWTKDEGTFVPHASTWLNGRRWEDERPAQAPATEDDDVPVWQPPRRAGVTR